jgi:hypothetical protein
MQRKFIKLFEQFDSKEDVSEAMMTISKRIIYTLLKDFLAKNVSNTEFVTDIMAAIVDVYKKHGIQVQENKVLEEATTFLARNSGVIGNYTLSDDELHIVATAINTMGDGNHPIANPDSLTFKSFKTEYALECLRKLQEQPNINTRQKELIDSAITNIMSYR